MARGRMIDNCISISEKINDLSLKEAFIYTWIIPHLDDWGRISGSPRTIKALVFPMKKEITIPDIEKALTSFKAMGLFLWEQVNGSVVLQQPFEDFNSHQSISENKRAKSKFPEILEVSQEMPRIPKNPQESPAQVNLREVNIREEKRKKEKHRDNVFLTLEEHKKLIEQLGKDKTNEMIEKLDLYIGSKGDKYKNHYSTILNWVRMEKEKAGPVKTDTYSRAFKCYQDFSGGLCTSNYNADDETCQICKQNKTKWREHK